MPCLGGDIKTNVSRLFFHIIKRSPVNMSGYPCLAVCGNRACTKHNKHTLSLLHSTATSPPQTRARLGWRVRRTDLIGLSRSVMFGVNTSNFNRSKVRQQSNDGYDIATYAVTFLWHGKISGGTYKCLFKGS